MSPEFFETKMGRQFYDSTMPRIATALEAIVGQLETRHAAVEGMAAELIADDPGKLETETLEEWVDRLHTWCERATALAKAVQR